MKTEENKTSSINEQLRKIRDDIGEEMKDMSPKQVIEYLRKKKTLHPASFWNKKK